MGREQFTYPNVSEKAATVGDTVGGDTTMTTTASGNNTSDVHNNTSGAPQVLEVVTLGIVDTGYTNDLKITHRVVDTDGTTVLQRLHANPEHHPVPLDPGFQVPDGGFINTLIEDFTGTARDVAIGVLLRQT